MLTVEHLTASYGMHKALASVSLHVESREIVVILGANGAGKSTLLRCIAGVCEGESAGDISLDGRSLVALDAEQIVEAGIAFVPEGRGIFGDLSVQENLMLGAYTDHARERQQENLERVLTLFPKLGERKKQIARTMSGGEQQMVAIGRALMSAPSVLMLDEPSLGLSPLLCKELFSSLTQVRESGVGILLVEQNAKQSLGIADRGYLLENGEIVGEDSASQLLHDPAVQAAYLGGAVSKQTSMASGTAAASQSPPPQSRSPQSLPPRVHTIVPQTETAQATVTADSLIGDDIDALVARASSVATTRTHSAGASVLPGRLPGDSVAASGDAGSKPAGSMHSSNTGTTHSSAGRPLPETQDAKVQKLLADFEAAAQAAAGGLPTALSQPIKNRVDDDPNNLPHIPVYRKSPVTVYRRDGSGTLRKQGRA